MVAYISFGKWNKNCKYIFIAILINILYDIIYGVNYEGIFEEFRIFGKSNITFNQHIYIHEIFNYLGVFIFALILSKIESNATKTNNLATSFSSDENDINQCSRIVLIHNEDLTDFDYSAIFYTSILAIFILVIAEQFLSIYGSTMKDLDFWMFEIAILSYINSKMFTLKMHKHQKLGIILNCCSFLFKFGSIISSICDKSDNNKPIYVKYNIFAIGILGFLVYMISITLRSYSNSKLKWLMDLRYIRTSKILLLYGLMGTIICLIISIISTFIKCKNNFSSDIVDLDFNYIDFNDYICYTTNITYVDNINSSNINNSIIKELYFENFKLFFKKFNCNDAKEIVFEIAFILLIMLISFFLKYFILLIIKYLTPVHATFYFPIYFLFQKLLLGLNTLIRKQKFFTEINKYKICKFHFDISGDFLSIIGFLIYLEIIELNFCNLNYNIKSKIMLRCLRDAKEMGSFDSSFDEREDSIGERESIQENK